jgi:hypothetical protein
MRNRNTNIEDKIAKGLISEKIKMRSGRLCKATKLSNNNLKKFSKDKIVSKILKTLAMISIRLLKSKQKIMKLTICCLSNITRNRTK